jgi:preprotein translocase subunit SecA
MYKKLSGMTGTADTEAEEFSQIYGLETIIIPPHRPTIRLDNGDKIYRTNSERYEAVIEDIRNRHTNSQPVLVGTTSIENSEFISKILNKEKLPHQVLNAKQHEKEAHIITQAGQPGVITIATNMAGRGTDIVLGGNIEPEIDKLDRVKQKKKIKDMEYSWKKRHQEVIDAGGLHIIGTERHESRRIDNQLRGRAGRQGDPGSSSFYLALDDSLLRLFGGDRVASIMDKLKLPEGEAIEHSMVTRSVESAQRKVEARNFDSRKQLLEFDDVPNNQRKVIYEQRNDIIDSEDIQQSVSQIRESVVVDTVYEYMPPESIEEMWDIKALEKRLKADYAIKINIKSWLKKEPNIPIEKIANKIKEEANKNYRLKEKKAGVDVLHHFERSVMLQIIDQNWRAHLSSLDQLRQGIGLRAYGQKDPKQEFKKEAFSLFEQLLEKIKFEIIRVLMLVQVKNEEQVNEMDKKNEAKLQTAKSDSAPKKVSRNDPCPCGSKKKYKHCHGKLI